MNPFWKVKIIRDHKYFPLIGYAMQKTTNIWLVQVSGSVEWHTYFAQELEFIKVYYN